MTSFTFVLIPSDESQPIEELQADKSGGLTDDELLKHAKSYFDSPVDITALTIPVPVNNYTACSMYVSADGGGDPNPRASALVTACGHGNANISGDAFCGRARDDEGADVWERIDFTKEDADPVAEWCRQARRSGGGGGSGTSKASSLNNLVQSQLLGNKAAPPAIVSQPAESSYGRDGAAPVQESWGTWTQTNEEVDLRITVAKDVSAKDCKVTFRRNIVKITVSGQDLVTGTTFDPIDVDESTYYLQTEGNQRELCVSLCKADAGGTWAYAIR